MVKISDALKAMCLDSEINDCLQGIEYGEGGDFYILNLECWDAVDERLTKIYFNLFHDGTYSCNFKLNEEDIEFKSLYIDEHIIDLVNKVPGIWRYLCENEGED